MKRHGPQFLFAAFLGFSCRGDTALTIGDVAPLYVGGGGPCWTSGLIGPLWPSFSSSNAFNRLERALDKQGANH